MSPSLRQDLSAMGKIPNSLEGGKILYGHGPTMLVRDQEFPASNEGMRPSFDLAGSGWNNTLAGAGKNNEAARLKSMSEMRHDMIVHETNEDITNTQRSVDHESKAPATMSTRHIISQHANGGMNSKNLLKTLANSI